MSDVLDQADIDSLLSNLSADEDTEERTAAQIFTRHRHDAEDIEIRPYDFKRPERISKDQMTALRTLHETFARSLGASLSGFLRTIVELRVASAEQMTYAEFTASLPNPTSFNLINASPLDGQVCLEISPLIIYPVIDRLLGGTNQELFIPQRAPTVIESRLIGKILERATASMTEAWDGVCDIDFTLGEMESNPQLVQIVPPNEVVVVIGFEIKMTNRAGTMALAIPFNVIEPLMDDLSAQNWFAAGKNGRNQRLRDHIADQLIEAPVEVSAVLAETSITLADLSNLEIGDLITTGKPANTPIVLCVESVPKFLANLGQHKGKRATKITARVDPADQRQTVEALTSAVA